MLSRAALLVLVAVGCNRPEPRAIPSPPVSAVVAHVERFVSAGRTPSAFAELAVSLADVHVGNPAAGEAELKLVALAAPLADSLRSRPLTEQSHALGLTVWPALLGVSVHAGESTEDYLARVCAGELRGECGSVEVDQRAIVVRAAAMRRGDIRMHEALSKCLECRGDAAWERLAWTWESLDREATGYVVALQREAARPHVIAAQ